MKTKIKIDNLFDELEEVIKTKSKGKKSDIECIIKKIKKEFSKGEFNKEERRIIRNFIHEIKDRNKKDLKIEINVKKQELVVSYNKDRIKFSMKVCKTSFEYASEKISKNKHIKCSISYIIGIDKSVFTQKTKSEKDVILYTKDLKTGTERWNF